MPSQIGLTYKREAAANRLRAATNQLRSRGVNVGTDPRPLRDPEARALAELERTADLLEAAVARIDELQASNAIPMGTVEVTVRDMVEHEAPGIEEIVAAGVARYLEARGPGKDNEDNAVAVEVEPLAEAITAAWAEAWSDQSDAEAEPADESAGYADLTVAELRDLLKEREIDVPANSRKADLIAALEQADADAEGDADSGAESEAASDAEADTVTDEGS